VRSRGGAADWAGVYATLQRRVGLLDGVVFSGGEPTLDRRLGAAIEQVRALGHKAALHTAGIYPDRLAELLPHLDWVGFDLKTGFGDYDMLTRSRGSAASVRRALDHLLASGVDHELRTTYHPQWVSDAVLREMARWLKKLGVRHWVLQPWRAHDDGAAALAPSWHWPADALLHELRDAVPALTLRRQRGEETQP
jgi:pyruvate formate lyase activating enzyme